MERLFKMLIKFNFGSLDYSYYNNNLQEHREDGPAIKWKESDDEYFIQYEYWLHDNMYYSESEYWSVVRFKGYL